MVSTSEVSISVSIDATDDLPAMIADLSRIATVRIEEDKALVCLVGDNIQGQKGLSERVFAAVRDINLDMISQGANGINMSFMVDGPVVEEAVRSLHKVFFENPDPTIFDIVGQVEFTTKPRLSNKAGSEEPTVGRGRGLMTTSTVVAKHL
jgi:aspartate kinase